jgi:hypothetical protein
MKLAKLSLAAVMAAGALTTVSATPLEEAIKGVEVSGWMRYRYYDESDIQAKSDRHRFSAPITFVSPVADNIKAGITFSVEQNSYAGDAANGTDDVTMSKFWFKYLGQDYSVRFGKQEIATPWTESGYGGSKGNGAVAMYTGVEGWTLAAAGFVNTSGLDADNIDTTALNAANGTTVTEENLYAAAAIGAVGPVNLQVWAARMTNVFDSSIFAQADMNMAGFGLKAQMNSMKLNSELGADDDSGIFYGVEGTFAMDNFTIGAGYTSTDDDMPIYTLDADDDGMLKYGQQIYYTTVNVADADTIAVFANATFGKIGLGAGYVDVSIDNDDSSEYYGTASYKYSKNFGLSAYYSVYEDDADSANDNNEFRFEAKYSF